MRYFEDFSAGEELPFGPHTVTRAEIVAFAAEFDPQPFHLDERAAADTLLGGLAASGWHTCALFMRMVSLGWLNDSGVDGLARRRQPEMDAAGQARRHALGPLDRARDARLEEPSPTAASCALRHEVVNGRGEPVMLRREFDHDSGGEPA